MSAVLAPSTWTVPEARAQLAGLKHVTTTADEYDVVEHFNALCSYLDELYGGPGFEDLLPVPARQDLAARIRWVRGRARTGAPALDGNGVPVDLTGPDADPVDDRLVRFDQPVNSSLTLADGRRGAAFFAAADGWQRQLGLALLGLYDYLDELHGGPGSFVELLTSEEREEIAAGGN